MCHVNPDDHPKGTRVLLKRSFQEAFTVIICEWTPIEKFVRVEYDNGSRRWWTPDEQRRYRVMEVLCNDPGKLQ